MDRYDDVASVSLFSLGWFRRRDELEAVLRDETGAQRVVFKVDAKSAKHEGMHLDAPAPTGVKSNSANSCRPFWRMAALARRLGGVPIRVVSPPNSVP